MRLANKIFLAVLCVLISAVFSASVLAHVCNDVATEGGGQWGCPDPINTTNTAPSVNGNLVEFTINVKNRHVEYYGYGCNDLGLPYCFECRNWQGQCTCNTGGWTGTLSNVRVQLASCNPSCDLTGCPDCDFNVSVTPASGQTIANENSRNYDIDITVFNANGDYGLTFNVLSSTISKTRTYLVGISVEGGQQGTGGDNYICPACTSQSCDTVEGTCESTCTGATYCYGGGCDFDTGHSGSAESCCGDDSGENFRACGKAAEIGWTCPSQAACCEQANECAYSGSCYANGNMHQLTTGDDAFAYCSSGTWKDCDEGSAMCTSCGLAWAGYGCCGDDSGEGTYARSMTCSSGCTTNSSDSACCGSSDMCVYNGACYAPSSSLCAGGIALTCGSGAWTGENCSVKASTETDTGCSDYFTAGIVRDYSSCSGSQCAYSEYADSCAGTMLTEYCSSGAGYTSSQYNCSNGNGCISNLFRLLSCSGGRCLYTDYDPDQGQSYCAGCNYTWSESECCGDDGNEYYAELCPGVSGVSRKCCTSSVERINALGQCTTNCNAAGTGGDNSGCSGCSSQSCDTVESTCESSCTAAAYCYGTECDFDTANPGSVESCCGDDSGENFRACGKAAEIGWTCPSQAACCEQANECAYSGSCYAQSSAYHLTTGEDAYAYCSSGMWRDCDEGSATCSGCGFFWNGTKCCGDDAGELSRSRVCSSVCTSNTSDRACCSSASACVYGGGCYSSGAETTIGGTHVVCDQGSWREKTQAQQQTCSASQCNANDACQSCPGCAYLDYSCINNICVSDFKDPDSSEQYCKACNVMWTGTAGSKSCCGDDANEYAVDTCPDATGVAKGCCNKPGDRLDQSGACVSSCGLQIKANVTQVEESFIPMAISFLPDTIEIEPGDTIDFKVYVRTEWNQSLHNVSISFCKEFDFTIDPPVIAEVRPNEIVSFSVNMHVPDNATAVTRNLEVYVNSEEMTQPKSESGVLKIGKVDYTMYFVYGGVIIAIVAVVAARKLLTHKENRAGERKVAAKAKTGKEARQEEKPSGRTEASADSKLADYVKQQMARGVPADEIKGILLTKGWSIREIEAAMEEARQ